MFRRNIQRDEVMPLILDFRPIRHNETHPAEYLQQLANGLSNDVHFAYLGFYSG